MDMSSEELHYDFDSRSHPYYDSQNWALDVTSMVPQGTDTKRNISPIHSGVHGLRQTTMGEHPMMGDWHFQQQLQQQQVRQQLQQHHHDQQQIAGQQPGQHPHTHHQQPYIPHHPHTTSQAPTQQYIEYHQQQQSIDGSFDGILHSMSLPTATSMIPVNQALPVTLPLEQAYMSIPPSLDGMHDWTGFRSELVSYRTQDIGPYNGPVSPYQQQTSSPTGSHYEILSQHSDENGWYLVDGRTSFESSERSLCVDPSFTLHDRTVSESSHSDSGLYANLDMGVAQAVYSPISFSDSDWESYQYTHRHSIDLGSNVDHNTMVQPITIPSSSKISSPVLRSPVSQTSAGSPGRKTGKKSPIVAKGTERVTKKTSQGGREEKRVGKRKGPLKPEQRKQASEIRKLRACLRCKFLKKTCDKGEPCAGCQPSHARLWQVPCTRIDIKEIGYFLKDKKFDYERHVSLGFSVGNIKGFSDAEKTLYITHGYGHMLPITAREVYVRDDKCLKMDWVEANKGAAGYEVATAKLSAGTEGISTTMLSDYLDQHIDGGNTFVKFVDDYFEGTPFLSEMLKAGYNFYAKTHSKIIKKALKLMLAYNLTLHITMIEGVPLEESFIGKIEDKSSKFYGKTMAPVMINFQIKCAMADMWRELHKDVLEELSALYSSVYSGDKLKNWPTIFILASILLAVWECMQFDCHYRVPDESAVEKFCNDMETTPVGVIVGLFSAISQKLPSILEWDTSKHHALLASNWDVCNTMSEVREHVTKYESYLRDRPNVKFDSKDFDSLSNKFLSRLVLRDVRAN
ncbi:hypothetical protein LTS08_007185 [Lithohypha guttulata]|uniref:C6 finger domain-containing protein n=1 Tax=Lithohypha guttulata TaxID=1690604 RepID=A0AAN7T2I1_9EURO|nr:hypothetical protein LTR05_003940 [Lithohypha guttulata]KAK5097164.1 hypothetical protein LTS08_007185 [Lithohypha guttulata]